MGRTSIIDHILRRIMESIELEQHHIDKGKEILDMVSFDIENGREVILIKIGENIEIKIKK
jgi:predicted metalloenzyme YecM